MTPANSLIQPTSANTDFTAMQFLVQQMLQDIETVTLVKVVACTNSGAVSAVGFVDVQPLVNQVDGLGNGYAHVVIHGLPYFRLQGGANAVIIDPQVGDIGIAAFCSRDISGVKATKAQSNPGTYRKYDLSDGVYLGGLLNGAPSQYVRFASGGITIHSPTKITLDAPDITLNAQTIEINGSSSVTLTAPTFTVNANIALNGMITQGLGSGSGTSSFVGTMTVNGDVVASGTSVHTHVHSGVTPGGGNTGAPV